MIFFTILELTAQGGIFVLKQTYHLGNYLIYGKQKTREEILEEKLELQIERENQLLSKLEKERNLLLINPTGSSSRVNVVNDDNSNTNSRRNSI